MYSFEVLIMIKLFPISHLFFEIIIIGYLLICKIGYILINDTITLL